MNESVPNGAVRMRSRASGAASLNASFRCIRADLLELASSKFSPCPATAEVEDEDELEDDYD